MASRRKHGSREAEIEELRTNARILSLVYDTTSDAVFLVRVEGGGRFVLVTVNASFLRLGGFTAEQVVNAPLERIVPEPNVARVRSYYERVVATRERFVYQGGGELPAGLCEGEITLIPIFDGTGPVTHVLGSVHDVTARRAAERDRERLLESATFLSDAARLLVSLDVDQALGDVARLAVPFLGDGCAIDLFGDGPPRRVAACACDPRRPMVDEVHPTVLAGHAITHRAGSICFMGVPLLVGGCVVGAITLRSAPGRQYDAASVQLVEELAQRAALAIDNARLYRHARESLRARDEFLEIAAHEIRGPVTSIHLAVQGILRREAPPEVLERALAIVEREDRRLGRFTEDLLDFGRLQTGRLQLHLEDVNVADLVQTVLGRVNPALAASGSSLTVSVPADVIGQWDRNRLAQVVENLLANAIKFGSGRPIEVSASRAGGRMRLDVKDHGIGIDPERLPHVFEPFARAVSARHYGGLGLGLHIVKRLVDAMGGTASVESTLGAGSTFTVELPLEGDGRGRSAGADPRR